MEIVPLRQEYIFSVTSHAMRAVVEHVEGKRKLSYFFDQKLVQTRWIEGGAYYTDDDCIREVVDEYRKSKTDVYADLLNRHTDKILLVTKLIEVDLVNYGIVLRTKVKIVKDYYELELFTEGGENQFSGRFKAADFSEVLEKMRLFTSTLEGVSLELAQKINILSNNEIEKVIKWQE